MIDPTATIHPLALVEGATVGAGTKVWQFANVIRNAQIGERCIVGAGAQIDGARIGSDCHIQNGASICHGVEIQDRVFIGPLVAFCNDAWPDVTHDGINHEALAAGCTIRIEEGASIGAGAIILPGVIIGARAVVAAGAVVENHVPADMVFRRNGYIASKPVSPQRMRLLR